MNRWWILAVAAVLTWQALGAATAFAQFPIGGYSPPQVQMRPTINPLLNLNRAGASPGVNYFALIRPQQQAAQQLQTLQNQQSALANELGGGTIAPGQPVPLSPTGHPVYYFDYSRYFPLQGLPLGSGAGFGNLGAAGLGNYGGAGTGGLGAPLGRTGITPGLGLIVR